MPTMPADQLIDQVFRVEGTLAVIQEVMRPIANALLLLEVGQAAPPLVMPRLHGVPVPDESWRDARELLGEVVLDLERKRDALEAAACTVGTVTRKTGDTRIVKAAAARKESPDRGRRRGRLDAGMDPEAGTLEADSQKVARRAGAAV